MTAVGARRSATASSVALVWLCSVAPLGAVLIPLLLPVLQRTLHLGPQAVGLLASADLAGVCLANVTAPLWLTRVSSRRGALLGLAVIAVANSLAAFASAPAAVLVERLLAGIGTGLVFSSSIPVIATSRRPARVVSAIQVLQLVLAAGALATAGWLLARVGVRPVLFGVVVANLLSMPLALLLPATPFAPGQRLPSLADLRPVAPVLFAIFLYFVSLQIITNYAGQLGAQHGLSIAALSSALAVGNLGALPGSLIAGIAGRPRQQRLLLVAATLLQCVAVAVMLASVRLAWFAAAFFVIQICITIMAPLQVAALVARDVSKRGIEAMPAMQSLGQAAGPFLASFAITTADVGNAYVASMLCAVASVVLVIAPMASARAPSAR